jgi:hypothetical protein
LKAGAGAYSSIEDFIAWTLRAARGNISSFMNALKNITTPFTSAAKDQLLEALNSAYFRLLSFIPESIKLLIALPILIFLLPIAYFINIVQQIIGQSV